MQIDNTQIRARAIVGDDFHETIRLLLSKLEGEQYKRKVLIADHWEELSDGAYVVPVDHEHGVRIPKQAAQALLDDFWQMGMRPSNYQDVVGTLEKHLADLQKIMEWQRSQIDRLLPQSVILTSLEERKSK